MLQTKYGSFDGDSWEVLCQIIFKSKYINKQYQEMVASPGDYGIEGFTKLDGMAFQCYCPDHPYTQKELYEKQRDKITEDLGKLKKFQSEIRSRLGTTVLKEWIFVTPLITDNKLLKHAESKNDEVLSWKLPIIDPAFKVIIHDAEFYNNEIYAAQRAIGNKITLFSALDISSQNAELEATEYEENIARKNRLRCTFEGCLNEKKFASLNRLTARKWLDCDDLLKQIERDASEIYFHIMRAISQYESEVEELCITWKGEAEDLISRVREELAARIAEAMPDLGEAERYRLSDQMTSKWLALCPLDFE